MVFHIRVNPSTWTAIFLYLAVGIERDKCMENVNGCNLCIANSFFSGRREVENYSMLIYLNLFCNERGTQAENPPRLYIICPRSSDPFYIVSCYIKRVTTSCTHSTYIEDGTYIKCKSETIMLL